MRRYYTRACNFYYGNESKLLVNKKKSIPLNGNKNISFDQIEIISRVSKRKISIKDINSLAKSLKKQIKLDLKKIKSKHKNFSNLNFLKLPNIMGVLNVTPDSFSDGGKFNKYNKGLKHALEMFSLGANIIDIGGESTRPGSKAISSKIEWQRIEKIIKSISKKIPISLDTRKSYVMKKGIKYGVKIINDVSGLNYDSKTIDILKKYKTPFVIQHSKGNPENMQNRPSYKNELLDIYDFFEEKIDFCIKKNFKKEFIVIDPGIGFGKNLEHNLRIMSKISTFHSLGCAILIGTSRKRFIEHIVTKFDTPDRTGGTLASVLYGLLQGVQLFRVHNVKEINQGILVFNKILNTN